METTTIHYLARDGATRHTFNGLYTIVPAGVVMMLTKASQVFIPWHRIIEIEQYINASGLTLQEVERKKLSQTLRSN